MSVNFDHAHLLGFDTIPQKDFITLKKFYKYFKGFVLRLTIIMKRNKRELLVFTKMPKAHQN